MQGAVATLEQIKHHAEIHDHSTVQAHSEHDLLGYYNLCLINTKGTIPLTRQQP